MPGAAARELGLLVTLVLNCAVSNDLQITMGLVVLRWIQCSAASTTLRLSDTDSANIDLVVPVDRRRHYEAVGHHPSQALPTSMPW
jgi:hypothetical protein